MTRCPECEKLPKQCIVCEVRDRRLVAGYRKNLDLKKANEQALRFARAMKKL